MTLASLQDDRKTFLPKIFLQKRCDIFAFSVLIDMGWKVFLPERFFEPVENKIHEIAGSVGDCVPEGPGLMGGKAGLACFYACYADWTGDRAADGLAADLIGQALNPAAGRFPSFSHSDGLAGIAWLIHVLAKEGILTHDASSVFDYLDGPLYEAMMAEIRAGNYDFLHGALGISLYFLRQTNNRKYRLYLAEMVSVLGNNAEQDDAGGLKWMSVLEPESGKTGYNLSLSHGMASIVIMLARFIHAGISVTDCSVLLAALMKYFDRQWLDPEEHQSCFPAWAIESMDELHASRLAWCYGDPGIGLAYYEAGKCLQGTSYMSRGLDILMRSAERRDPADNGVRDAGICHGAAGLALFYNILYQKTGYTVFAEASLHWLDVCLNMAVHDTGIAGYKSWYLPEYGGWKNNAGLLEGAAGIGLVLLSFIHQRKPAWAGGLLLSVEDA